MSVVDSVREALGSTDPTPDDRRHVPGYIDSRVKRGRARMRETSAEREECIRMWRGDQYVYRAGKAIQSQATTSNYDGGGKPKHRIRTVRNMLIDPVAHGVSSATSRVPSYEVNPTTSDAEDISAAAMSAKVALWGYDQWRVRSVIERVVTYALVADEGFAWPYWDSSIGPYFDEADELGQVETIGQGEVRIRVFGPNEVFWEPGISFDDSPWHAVEQARTIESVREIEGYYGDPLTPNAQAMDGREANPNSRLVLVTEYLERPCSKYPNGRWLTMAEGKQICPERAFPCTDPDGNVIDEPVLHKLSYITDPESDRDMGLVRHLLDAQRTYNDCTNKQLMIKNLALAPKLAIQNGRLKKGERITDEPAQVIHIEGNGNFEWMPFPGIPPELSQLKEEAKGDIGAISAQNDLPGGDASGKNLAVRVERDLSRGQSFFAKLAEFHSRLARHCLYLVQKHYTEPRLLMIRGDDGVEPIRDFLGAQLRGQMDVTVLPGSIEPRTRAALEARLNSIAQMFPGRYTPEEILYALEAGTAETLIKSYERDVRRARTVIQKIRDDVFWATPHRPVFPGEDPGPAMDENGEPIVAGSDEMGQPVYAQATTVAGWMPRPIDDLPVHKKVFADHMKTDEFDRYSPDQQQACMAYYAALIAIEQREAARQAEQQLAEAESRGMSAATRPAKTPPLPLA